MKSVGLEGRGLRLLFALFVWVIALMEWLRYSDECLVCSRIISLLDPKLEQ